MNRRLSRPTYRSAHGLSLVELMVAVTIGLLLLAGLTSLVMNTSRSFGELTKTSRQLESGRYALQLLKEEVEHAGFFGELATLDPPPSLPDPCDITPATLSSSILVPIQGYDAPTGTVLSCLTDANHLDGTDILVLRRAATAPTPPASLDANDVYIQTTNAQAVIDTGANATSFTLMKKDAATPADIRKLRADIYFISPCNTPSSGSTCDANADGGRPIPTLKRLSLVSTGSGPALVTQPLAEGIEELQVEYGIDRENAAASVQFNGIPNESTSGAGDAYVTAPGTLNDWVNVVAIRLYLLARHPEPTDGYTDTKSYDLGLGGTTAAPNDSYKRRLFTILVRAVNPSSRKEQPS